MTEAVEYVTSNQIILRPSGENIKDLELFIGNQHKNRVYLISLRKQIVWLFLILRNIVKYIKLDV